MTHIISIANQKGGVGKTTTAVNVATGLAAMGYKTLLLDLDAQSNATTGVGINPQEIPCGTYELIRQEKTLQDVIQPTFIPNLYLCPSSFDLSGVDIELVNQVDREYRIRDQLSQSTFDYILIDCPPALNLLTINALTASTSLLIPLQCEYYALEGLAQLIKTQELVKEYFNPGLTILGIVMTMFDGRNRLSQQVIDDVKNHMLGLVFHTVIPRNVKVSESPSFGKPVVIYDMKCTGSLSYLKLVSEMIKRLKGMKHAA